MAVRAVRMAPTADRTGVSIMCLTCGCMDAHLEMGESNITFEDIKRAADENGDRSPRRSTSSSGRRPGTRPTIPASTTSR